MTTQSPAANAAGRNFHLPADDPHPASTPCAAFDGSAVIHQPEVYVLADFLCGRTNRGTIVDLGCGSGRALARTQASRRIGLDLGGRLEFVRRHWPTIDAREANFEDAGALPLSDVDPRDGVVVCANVVEGLKSPYSLLAALGELYRRGAIILLSTLDRDRVHGGSRPGSPPRSPQLHEWNLAEFVDLLSAEIAPPVFAGRTIADNQERRKATLLCVLDKSVRDAIDAVQEPRLRPLAIINTFNDREILRQLTLARLAEGLDLYCIDNWSTDGTDKMLGQLAAAHPDRIAWERFPADGPAHEFDLRTMLKRKSEVAALHPGRWIVHMDSDELLRSPWPGMPLWQALDAASRAGANAVDFAVLNFTPTADGFGELDDPLSFFSHFEFGQHPAHFVQRRAWMQNDGEIDISTNGGHDPIVPERKLFPYRFVNQHYPIRSQRQGLRKILHERRPRYSRAELAMGWHNHYQSVTPSDVFVRPAEGLEPWFAQSRQEDYLVEIISDAVLRRIRGSLLP